MENQSITNPSNIVETTQIPNLSYSKTYLVVSIILTALISGVIFGLGGYYFGKQSFYYNQVQIIPATLHEVINNNSPTTISNLTANWKTYTNIDPAYSIKYPGDWIVDSSRAKADPLIGSEIIISKGSYKLSISWPSNYSPSGCIFEDQLEYLKTNPMFPGLCKGEYKQFMGETNTFRRLINPRTDTSTPVWNIYTKENSSNYFVGQPPINYTAAKNYEPKEIDLMDSILSTFKSN